MEKQREFEHAELEARCAEQEAIRAKQEPRRAELEANHALTLEAYAQEKQELEHKLQLALAKRSVREAKERPIREFSVPNHHRFVVVK